VNDEVFSEIVEVEELCVPSPCMMFVIIVTQQNVTPTLLFHELWSKLVSDETFGEIFSDYALEAVVFESFESILQSQQLQPYSAFLE